MRRIAKLNSIPTTPVLHAVAMQAQTNSTATLTVPLAPWEQTLRELQNSWAATYLESRPVMTVTPKPASPRPVGC